MMSGSRKGEDEMVGAATDRERLARDPYSLDSLCELEGISPCDACALVEAWAEGREEGLVAGGQANVGLPGCVAFPRSQLTTRAG